MKRNNTIERKILKAILWIYIILCIAIAALNYGYASHATEATANFIRWFWHFYENWIKTAVIIICSILTLRIIGTSRRITMRKRNLIGITISALAIHIVAPLILNNIELYFFVMPLPWTTTPLQLLSPDSLFLYQQTPSLGTNRHYNCIDILCMYERYRHFGDFIVWKTMAVLYSMSFKWICCRSI